MPRAYDNLKQVVSYVSWPNFRKSVRTSCDTKTGHEVVGDSPQSRLPLKRGPVGSNESIDGHSHDQSDIEPVDMLVPVLLGDGLLCDMRLLWIVSLVAVGFSRLCHARWRLRGVLWWRGHSGDVYGKVVRRRREEKEACGRWDLIKAPRVSNDTLVSQTVGRLARGEKCRAGPGRAGQRREGLLTFSFWWEVPRRVV